MKKSSNFKVFILIKSLECIWSCISFIVHMYTVFSIDESYPHDVVICGTFSSFTFLTIFSIVYQAKGILSYYIEAVFSLLGFTSFMTSSIYSMVLVENDEHLVWMTEEEEYRHPFFINNRLQSIAALITTFLFLMHLVFSIDYLINKSHPKDKILDDPRMSLFHRNIPLQLKLYFFPEYMWKSLTSTFRKCKKSKTSK